MQSESLLYIDRDHAPFCAYCRWLQTGFGGALLTCSPSIYTTLGTQSRLCYLFRFRSRKWLSCQIVTRPTQVVLPLSPNHGLYSLKTPSTVGLQATRCSTSLGLSPSNMDNYVATVGLDGRSYGTLKFIAAILSIQVFTDSVASTAKLTLVQPSKAH